MPRRRFMALYAMAAFIYRCPNTGFRVQGWVADDWSADNGETYEAVKCLACQQLHFVNPKTERTLGVVDD
jgi:hypothetical protein